MNKEKDYNKIINRLFILIGIGLLLHAIFLAYTIDPKSFELLYRIKWYYLVLITILAISPWIGHAFRIVMESVADYPISFKSAFAIVVANDIGAAITPTAVGGGPVKIGMLVNKGHASTQGYFYGFIVSHRRHTFLRYGHCIDPALHAPCNRAAGGIFTEAFFPAHRVEYIHTVGHYLGWKTVKLVIKKYYRIFRKLAIAIIQI